MGEVVAEVSVAEVTEAELAESVAVVAVVGAGVDEGVVEVVEVVLDTVEELDEDEGAGTPHCAAARTTARTLLAVQNGLWNGFCQSIGMFESSE